MLRAVSRNKSFSPAVTLQQVADVFVERGYDGTSLAQLEAASGLGKQSLYNTFGDKKAMYLGAVECATARYAGVQALMQSAADGRQALQRFFDQLVQDCASGDAQRHSCIVSAGLLEGIDDDDIQQRLQAKWNATHALLKSAVARGQGDRSVASTAKPQELADHLMTAMSGLRVMARTRPGAARLKRVVAQALSVLDSSS
jgi:TetR/AcrR family transcriptional regulator, transcriptional repressor for nem operon